MKDFNFFESSAEIRKICYIFLYELRWDGIIFEREY